MWVHRSVDYRRPSDARPYPYAGKYTAQIQCIELYGIFKKKKCVDDIR